jgi:hypothetical protein
MCELTAILAIGSAVIGGIGQMQQANAQADAAAYNAQIADMNAQISQNRARDAVERGMTEEQQKRQQVARIKGSQMAAMAANGMDIGFGSALDTLVDTAMLGELDALTIRQNSERESYDFKVQAANQTAQGNLNRMEASSARTGGYLAAAGTILGGAGNAYKSWSASRVPTTRAG